MTRPILAVAALLAFAVPTAAAWTTLGPTWAAMPVTVEANTATLPKGVKQADHLAAVEYAASRWEALRYRTPPAAIDFAPVTVTARTAIVLVPGGWRWNHDGHSVVQYADFVTLGIPNNRVGMTSYYTDGQGNRTESDILLNSRVPFDATYPIDRRAYDLASVITHELGHVLGLGESADRFCGVMCPTLPLGATNGFTVDDINGAAALYPTP